jgi:hypothetical protein
MRSPQASPSYTTARLPASHLRVEVTRLLGGEPIALDPQRGDQQMHVPVGVISSGAFDEDALPLAPILGVPPTALRFYMVRTPISADFGLSRGLVAMLRGLWRVNMACNLECTPCSG